MVLYFVLFVPFCGSTLLCLIEAGRGFRKLRGYKDMPSLIAALRTHAEQNDRVDTEQVAA